MHPRRNGVRRDGGCPTVPNFPWRSHVRHFDSEAAVSQRYGGFFQQLPGDTDKGRPDRRGAVLPPRRRPECRRAIVTNQLDISVVVPTHNRVAGLSRLLDRLADQDADGIRSEVVVVDNNSTDDTRAVVERAIARDAGRRLRYVFEPRQGVSYARNTGIERTTAPLIAFLDDDGIPGPDWVRGMKRAFEQHSEADCIGGRVEPTGAGRRRRGCSKRTPDRLPSRTGPT